MRLKETDNAYYITDVPRQYSQFYEQLASMLRRMYQRSNVEITVQGGTIVIQRLEGSILVLGDHIVTMCEGYLLGCSDGFDAAVQIYFIDKMST